MDSGQETLLRLMTGEAGLLDLVHALETGDDDLPDSRVSSDPSLEQSRPQPCHSPCPDLD